MNRVQERFISQPLPIGWAEWESLEAWKDLKGNFLKYLFIIILHVHFNDKCQKNFLSTPK